MSIPATTRDTVLFLGAGFSFAAGVPTMRHFGGRTRTQLNALAMRHEGRPAGSRGYRKNAAIVAHAGRIYEAFQSTVNSTTSAIHFDPENLEDVFSMAELLDQANIGMTLLGQNRSSTEILMGIKQWIWDIYKKYPPHDSTLDPSIRSSEHPYQSLIRLLRDLQLLSRVSVITTNYDLVFEIASFKEGVICTYPLEDCSQSLWIRDGSVYVTNVNTSDSPVLCKLHGSVNFFTPQKATGNLLIADRWKLARPHDQPEVLFLDDSHDLMHRAGTSPELVPPSYSKLQATTWLSETFEYAINAIRNARSILFIGYSFPMTDGFMVAMMRSAMALRTLADPLQIWVVDPSADVLDRYRGLFPELDRSGHLRTLNVPFATNDDMTNEVRDAFNLASSIR